MGRQDEVLTVFITMQRRWFEIGGIEPLGVHYRSRHMAENQELLRRKAQVVAIGRATETEDRIGLVIRVEMTHQGGLEGLQHPRFRHFVDPAIVLEHQKPRRNCVT